jgi:hypothetical protein
MQYSDKINEIAKAITFTIRKGDFQLFITESQYYLNCKMRTIPPEDSDEGAAFLLHVLSREVALPWLLCPEGGEIAVIARGLAVTAECFDLGSFHKGLCQVLFAHLCATEKYGNPTAESIVLTNSAITAMKEISRSLEV